MAYMNQETKRILAPRIKAVLKKYGMKGTIGVRNHSALVVNVRSGKLKFDVPYHQVNPYWIRDNYEGLIRDFLLELKAAMNVGNHDNSDIQTDYFDVGWYISINVGTWNKPYVYEGE